MNTETRSLEAVFDLNASVSAAIRVWPWILALGLGTLADAFLPGFLSLTLAPIFLLLHFVVQSLIYLRLERATSDREAFAILWDRKWKFLLAIAASIAMLVIGVVLFVLPIFYVLARNAFVFSVVVSSYSGLADHSLQASDVLTQGMKWKLGAIIFVWGYVPALMTVALTGFVGLEKQTAHLIMFPVETLCTGLLFGCIAVTSDRAIKSFSRPASVAS
jgi:hypothetical protein